MPRRPIETWREEQHKKAGLGDYAGKQPALGDGDRSRQVHRLQRVRHRVPRREQRRHRRRGPGRMGRDDELDPHRALLASADEHGGRSRRAHPADAVPALRQRAVRAGLPGVRDLPHSRRAQRARSTTAASARATARTTARTRCAYFNWYSRSGASSAGAAQLAAQSGRHGAREGRDGEVHVLRAAHPRRQEPRRARGPRPCGTARSCRRAQQTCPAEAIVVRRPARTQTSRVAQLSAATARLPGARELNTQPGVTYLKNGDVHGDGRP